MKPRRDRRPAFTLSTRLRKPRSFIDASIAVVEATLALLLCCKMRAIDGNSRNLRRQPLCLD
jgi:hypothetical protein